MATTSRAIPIALRTALEKPHLYAKTDAATPGEAQQKLGELIEEESKRIAQYARKP